MDEPTAALGVAQSKAVLEVARRIAQSGVGVVLITHIMPHVMEVADRVVVLRHGRKVADMPAAELRQERLIALMSGYEEGERHERRGRSCGPGPRRRRSTRRPGST